jgi:hypothetical protein
MKTMFALLMTSMLIAATGFAAEPAKMLSKKEVGVLIGKASTPAEHNQLAQYYRLQAEKLEADANDHAEMAKIYRARPTASETKRPMSPDTAAHCEYFTDSLRKAAGEARTLSAAHAGMANQ